MELEKTLPDAVAVLRLWMCCQMNTVKTNFWAQIKKSVYDKKKKKKR